MLFSKRAFFGIYLIAVLASGSVLRACIPVPVLTRATFSESQRALLSRFYAVEQDVDSLAVAFGRAAKRRAEVWLGSTAKVYNHSESWGLAGTVARDDFLRTLVAQQLGTRYSRDTILYAALLRDIGTIPSTDECLAAKISAFKTVSMPNRDDFEHAAILSLRKGLRATPGEALSVSLPEAEGCLRQNLQNWHGLVAN